MCIFSKKAIPEPLTAFANRLLAFARQLVPRDFVLRRHWRAYHAVRQACNPPGRWLLEVFAAMYPHAFFIQIGSNDGLKLDPLRPEILASRWRGILIEPVPDLFAQLRTNYSSCEERLCFENLAIADRDGVLPFYHLAPVKDFRAEGLPEWYDALGSFGREVIAEHATAIPDIEKRIVQFDVPVVTFDTLCQRHDIRALDLLHIDPEGYDFELLKTIDFRRFHPRLVIFEHIHLKPEDQLSAIAYMEGHGYETRRDGMDTWCLNLRDTLPRDRLLLKLWFRLSRG